MVDPPADRRWRSKGDRVADAIRQMVLSGELKGGDRLVQDELAKRFGVSTVPVREALQQLKIEGTVVATRNRSFKVAEYSSQDIRDVFRVLGSLNAELAERACGHADDRLIEHLRAVHQEYLRATDDEASFRLHWAYFRAVHAAAQSPKIVLILRPLLWHFPIHSVPGAVEQGGKWQGDLLEAFVRRQPDLARAISLKYTLEAAELYIMFRSRPEEYPAGGQWVSER